MTFAIRTKVLAKAYEDPEYGPRLEKAETTEQLVELLIDFCHKRGYKVGFVKPQ